MSLPLNDSINRLLPDILLAAKDDDVELLNATLDTLDMKIVEFYSDIDKDWADIKLLFRDMRHATHSFPCNALRYERIQILYKKLKKSLASEVLSGELRVVVKRLRDDIFATYNTGFMNEDVDLVLSLKDKIHYLSELDERFREERPDLYGTYIYVLQEGDRCAALLIKLQPSNSSKSPNKVSFKRDSINDIANQFSAFFSAFAGLIGKFKAPEEAEAEIELVDEKEKTEDIEELKEEAKKQRIIDLLAKDWSYSRIGRLLSMTVDEIKSLLGFEANA